MPLRDDGRRLGGPSRARVALEYPQDFLGRLRRDVSALRRCCGVAGSVLRSRHGDSTRDNQAMCAHARRA